ncbi:MAG: protein O-mannosyl-transferase [Verrucomicrobiota bacterium]|jgi:Flp pilus assembly protein TadD
MPNRISEATNPRLLFLAVCFGLIAITWFVFGQTRTFPFINYDDPEYIFEVPEINHGLTSHGLAWAFTNLPSPNWYPLTNISHMVEARFYGMNAGGYHLTNVILHTMAAILLALFLWQSTGALWRSAFVAALFAIHPLRVESVAWVVERKDVLSGVFFMLTLIAYVAYARRPGLVRYALVVVSLACGLMSKPMLVTTPIVLLLLDHWPLRRDVDLRVWPRLVLEKLPLLVLSAASCATTIFAQTVARSSAAQVVLIPRLKNAVVSTVEYLKEMIWPIDLAVFYPLPRVPPNVWLVMMCAVILIALSAAAFFLHRKHPYILIGWLWFLGMLAPVMGIVQAGMQSHADRFTYLPQIGLYVVIAWSATHFTKRFAKQREILALAGIVVLTALALTARAQTTYWRDSETLWEHTIVVTKDNSFAHASLADLLLRRGRWDEAISHSKEALKVQPRDADAHNNLGLTLLQKGDETGAAAEFKESLAIDPGHMNAAPNLAWILATSSNPAVRNGPKAVELAEQVSQRAGHPNAMVLRTLAASYAECGRFREAIEVAGEGFQLASAQGNSILADELKRNIDNYRMSRPLRSGGVSP